ncbi:MAG: hypothetical protein ACREOP_08255, partial [Thermodesulfobacteriota bacterium]
ELDSQYYEGRIPEGAIPQISQAVPEFFAGVEIPQTSQFVLSNLDNVITGLRAIGGFKRGKRVIVSKGYGSINQGLVTIDPNETYAEYRGLIDSSSVGERAVFNLLPSDIDVFDKEFPFEKVTTGLWPNAIDLDDDIPWIAGTAKQVPLALVLAQETPSQQYQYLVGRGDLTVDVVYRDKLVTSTTPGTATGTTTSTATLEAGDQQADDYYNNKFIEMDGVVRLITDYSGSLNRVTVTPTGAWTAGAYTIREWKKVTQVISTVTYTLIEFARRQRDGSERMYQRDRMSADVTGLSTERNPARYAETLLGLFPDVALNSAGFTTAANAISAEGNLFVDGALVKRRRVFDILNQVCMIGRLRLRLNDSGELYPVMDGTEDAIYGTFKYNDNIITIGAPDELPLSELWKTLTLRYRVLFDEDDYRLTTAQHSVNSAEGRIDQVMDFDLIYDKTTADKVCDYLAKRKNSFDESIPVALNHEARGRELGQVINLELDIPLKSGMYQIARKELQATGFGFTVIPYAAAVFTYVAGALPSDPVTDSQADFRFTPAPAVTGLGVSTSALPKNFKAIAKLSWTNPASNFTDVLVQFKKTADSLYTSAGVVSGGGNSIEMTIETGTAYDYKVISFNQFRDPLLVGVATLLNQTSAGTAATPSTPGTPSITVKFRSFQGSLSSYTKPSNFLRFEWQYTDSGGTSVGGIFTSEGLIAPSLIESGTSSVTRKVKVRAVGIKSDGTEVVSSYSSLSGSAATAQIVTDDIDDGAVDENKRVVVYTHTETGTMLPLSPGQSSHSLRSWSHGLGKIPLVSNNLSIDTFPTGLIYGVRIATLNSTTISIIVDLDNTSGVSFASGIDWTVITKYW